VPGILSRAIDYHQRYGRQTAWTVAALVILVASIFYAQKAQEDRSAFVRWRHQVLQLWKGENIYNEMMFPNPPIMPITLYPLMTLPPVVGATVWFAIKVALTTVAILLCFRMAQERGEKMPAWVEGFIIFLSARPILSDLHHGNINLLILFLIVATLYSWRNGYDVLAGLLLALAIAYKVTPALFVPYFLCKRSWRTVGATLLGLVLFFLVVPSLVLGVSFNAQCLSMWWHRILSPYIVHGVKGDQEINQSMVGVLSRLLTESPISMTRYGHHFRANLVAWDPFLVGVLIKGLSLGLVGMMFFLCRTRTGRRDDPRLLGEFAIVVLTMLFMSERSWKHHYVTLLLPYTYLVYCSWVAPVTIRVRVIVSVCLWLSVLLMASTSSELGGLLTKDGHKVAQAYGMFFWAGLVLYGATAWRVRAEMQGNTLPGRRGLPPDRFSHFASGPSVPAPT
jgi:alpha-1,2-mannosyltransferase